MMYRGALFQIFLAFFYFCGHIQGTNVSVLQIEPDSVVVEHGSSVSVNCSTNLKHQGMGWEATQGSVPLTEHVQLITWKLESLQDWNIKPICYANFLNDKQVESELNITVYKLPDSVTISTVGHSGPMNEGQQYELQCDVQNVAPIHLLTVNWYKGETLLANNSFTDPNKKPVNESVTLQITPNRADDGAQYRCEAKLQLGPDGPHPAPTVKSVLLTITVYYGPEISCPSNITFLEGEPFNHNCTAKGHPQPEITWWKDDTAVDLPQKVFRRDQGQYTLLANNTNDISHKLEVMVVYPPSEISELVNTPVNRGENVTLKCSSSAKPRPEYEWRFYDASNVRYENTDGVSLLHINAANGLNNGNYTCISSNDLGKKELTVRVDVKGAEAVCPLTISPPHVVMEHGQSTDVKCTASSNHSRLHWKFVDSLTNSSTLHMTYLQLLDWDEKPSCYGEFIGLDSCRKLLNVTLFKRPDMVTISTVGHSGPMVEGNQYELQCDVQNVAPIHLLTVNWYKGETLLANNSFSDTNKKPVSESVTLQISPNRADDGAQYRCEAKLQLGPDGPHPAPTVQSEPLTITVHYKPVIYGDKLPATVPVFDGYPKMLACKADGNPKPTIKWLSGSEIISENENLTITDSDGIFICSATNVIGTDFREVQVIVNVLQINPNSVVVEHGSSVSVNCSTNLKHQGMGWEATQGSVPLTEHVQLITWKLESLQHWDIKPICYANFPDDKQVESELNITVYKLPDSVTISTVGHTGAMKEGQQYELQCDVQNVAPIHLLTVNWYKGETLLANNSFTDPNKKPVSESVTLQISPNRADDGAQYRCEAKLQLGPDGPHPAPTVQSDPLTITVHYKPVIYGDKLPATVPVFDGYPEMLVCKAGGNPKPTIKWLSGSEIISENENLTITNSHGIFNCTATNVMGTDFREVQVIMKGRCPLELRPPEVVVEYGSSFSADCFTTSGEGIGWTVSQGAVEIMDSVQSVTWTVKSLVQWDIKPFCFTSVMERLCSLSLPVTVYKTPDKVSISTVSHIGPMTESLQYELQCDVQNVAPVHLLTVNWYKGHHLVAKTSFSDSTKTPVNQSTIFHITVNRVDDGAQYRCEAELQVSRNRPGAQPTFKVSSQVLGLTVHYSPLVSNLVEVVNETAEDDTLNCTVIANPPPWYVWRSTNLEKEINAGLPVLVVSSLSSGNYTCTATNRLGSVSKLFIVQTKPKGGNRTIFWAVVGPFVGLALVMIVGYAFRKRTEKN
ncbi:intercellular adhesion molecule 5 [Trichomycterus rosablanca]|uniref:intercellular adhesion molecule 5 n=1 Tax=Trichomycterus rosablanca TaxID=2290929 RepID=UPI002F355906